MASDTPRGAVRLWDDFLGSTLSTFLWNVTSDTGDTAYAIPATPLVDGAVVSATAATDNNRCEIANALTWRALDGTLVAEARIKIDDPTTVAINFGLNVEVSTTGGSLPVELSGTTFTANSATAAVWVYDTDATNDTWHGFVVDATSAKGDFNSGIAPLADTYQTLRVEITDAGQTNTGTTLLANVEFFIDGEKYGDTIKQGINPNTLLTPYLAYENRAAAIRTSTSDYMFARKGRAVATG